MPSFMRKADLKLFVTLYHDATLLGHFLRHYQGIGVTRFYVAVAAEREREIKPLTQSYPVELVTGLDVEESVFGTAAVSAMREHHQEADEWAVIVDVDEFIESVDLAAVTVAAERFGANVVRGRMYDRLGLDGRPQPICADSDLDATFPVKAPLVRHVMRGADYKGVLVKGRLLPAPRAAHHRFTGERTFDQELQISHFKWTTGALEEARKRRDVLAAAGSPWAAEYQRVLAHYEARGRFAWEEFGGRALDEFEPEPPAALCDVCGGVISEEERDYSAGAFGRPLCRTDQTAAGEIPFGFAPR